MFGYGSKNNNTRMPKTPHTMILPQNYGFSHCFIDDDSQFVLELEQRGNIPTQEIAEKIKNASSQRTKEAAMWKKIGKDLNKLSKANAEIIKQAAAAKLNVARTSKRQYDSVSGMFDGMDRLTSEYEVTKKCRSQRLSEIRVSYQEAIANLRSNSNQRQKATTGN